MIAVIQRASEASVKINGSIKGKIGEGLVILLGIEEADDSSDIDWLCRKIVNLRVFPDGADIMNRSLLEVQGEILLISQFTLYASTKKGNRPSYSKAAKPEVAIPLYNQSIEAFQNALTRPIQTGEFGADMKLSLINDGPVTLIIDSKNKI
jgi:D-tyrosyl-tRNA(Tyr) deacylase